MTLNRSILSTAVLTVLLTGLVCSSFVPLTARADSDGRTSANEKRDKARSNLTKRKTEMGSSTRPVGERAEKRASSTRATSTKTVDSTCMQEAVNTREESIMKAFETFSASMLTAMEKRQTAFASVWTDTSINNPSKYNGIWTTWKKDTEAARKQLNQNRVMAWKTFRTTAKESCKATLPKAESESQETGATAI